LGQIHSYWTSLEGENPSGSLKDRMVEPELSLQKDKVPTVAEISAGSTALSISYYALKFKMQCRLFVPKGIDPLIKRQLVNRGAIVDECDPATAYEVYNDFIKKAGDKIWSFGQMSRKELKRHYTHWAQAELEPMLPPIDYVIGGIGTGHSLAGITEGLNPSEGSISVEPSAGTTVSGIRNAFLNNFGAADPWNPTLFDSRIETAFSGNFDSSLIETDQGPIYVSDSFKLTLDGLLKVSENWKVPKNIFIVGSHCRRINAVKNS
jgi:cysteine synthase A